MRNSDRVNIVAFYLTQHASFDNGKTVPEIIEATGISRTAVNRILEGPGFTRSNFPAYPKAYYYDPAQASRLHAENKKRAAVEAHKKEEDISAIVNRPYYKKVDEFNAGEAYIKAANSEIVSRWLDRDVEAYIKAMNLLVENVALFKQGGRLDSNLVAQVKIAAHDLLFNGETIFRAVGKILSVDIENPEWWTELTIEGEN